MCHCLGTLFCQVRQLNNNNSLSRLRSMQFQQQFWPRVGDASAVLWSSRSSSCGLILRRSATLRRTNKNFKLAFLLQMLGGKPHHKEEGMSATQLLSRPRRPTARQPAHQERPTHGPGPSRTSKSYQLYIYRGHQRASHPGLDQANGTVASSFPYLLYFLLPPSQIP